jgi:hypothetical protein
MNLEVEHDEVEKKRKVHLEASEVGLCLTILMLGIGLGLYFGLNCKFDK